MKLKLAVSRKGNTVLLEIILRDEYTAVVYEEHIIELIRSGDGLCLSFTPPQTGTEEMVEKRR